MLKIFIPEAEQWDENRQEFSSHRSYILEFEHSLESVSRWESSHCKAFLSKKDKTKEETEDYIRCMLLNEEEADGLKYLTNSDIVEIQKYIEAPMTAVYFHDEKKNTTPRGDTITSEVIYYWMIASNIPFECQRWHLNRLLALIRVCSIKNAPNNKKMSKSELARRNNALNAARRKQLNTRG